MTSEEDESISRRLNTSEGREELNRLGTELRERAQNMEPPTFPPASSPVIYEVKIRGDGRGVEIMENEG